MESDFVKGRWKTGVRYFSLLFSVLLLVFFALPTPSFAQVASGSISGTVVDPSGAAVPGATVVATNVATNAKTTAKSSTTGVFHVAFLPVGTYSISVSKTGFRTMEVSGISVSAAVNHGVGTLKLKVGAVSSTVVVTSSTPLMTTTQAQVSNSFSSTQLKNFAGLGGNEGLDNLAMVVPGVTNPRDTGFSNSNGPDVSVNGLRGRNNDQQIDGANNNDNSVAGPSIFLSNPDFVEQYQIITNNFAPEYGRNSGSVINIITKSGTNNWHGDIYGSESNSALDSLSNTQKHFLGLKKPPRFNDEFTDATIGGPLVKNKLFIFGGFDDEINSSKGVNSTGNLTPTAVGVGQMASCYPNSPSVQAMAHYGPFAVGGNPFSLVGSTTNVQLSGTEPDGSTYPGFTPNSGTVCDVQMSGIARTLSTGFHEYDWISRVDWVIGSKDRAYGRYIYNKSTYFNAFGDGSGYPVNVPALSQGVEVSWAHTISSSMINSLRFDFSRENVEFGGNLLGNTVPPQGAIGTALSYVSLPSGYLSFGPPPNLPQGRIVNTLQVQDNWSYFHGNSQWTAGVNFTRQKSPNIFLPNYNGSFTFKSMSAFAQDVPTAVNIAEGNPNLPFLEHDWFLYVGNNYHVTPNLTLNLGLTWFYEGQPLNVLHNETVQNESNPKTAFFNPSLPLSIRTYPYLPAKKNTFGPGIGFAYNPKWGGWLTGNGKTVIRGGYRLAYDPPYYNIFLNMAESAPLVLAQSLTGAKAAANPLPADPTGGTVRAELAPYLVKGVADPRSFVQTQVTPNFGPDRVHEWTLGIQRQVARGAVVEVRYVGNHAFDQFQSINLNPYIAGLAAEFPKFVPSGDKPCSAANAVVPEAIGRVNCNMGIVRQRTNTGFSNYNGLQLMLRTNNLFNQLSMNAGYTFSKTMDNTSEIFSTFGGGNTVAFSQDPLNYKGMEYGLSAQDIPQAFQLGFFEELPFFRSQRGVIGHILGGWGVSGVYLLESGQPYTPAQYFIGTFSGAVGGTDVPFNTTFIGTYETLRPFIGNSSAPINQVGIFAADACGVFGAGCALPPNAIMSFNALNTTGAFKTVTKSQVHFIFNGGEAQKVFGTPWGNAGRNILRDARTNIANIDIYKNFKFWERATLQWHMEMLNAFNHPNFSSVDPFLIDTANTGEYNGFGIPAFTPGGHRTIKFGIKILF